MNSIFSQQACGEANNSQDGENEKQNFCDFHGTCSNATEAEHGSNQCDDKKNNGVMQHTWVQAFEFGRSLPSSEKKY